jgi:CBS domain-containing protein
MNITDFRKTRINEIDVLTTNVPTVQPDAESDEIIKKLSEGLHFILVTSKDNPKKVEGVISASDLGKLGTDDAEAVMTKDVILVHNNQTMDDVARMMKETGKKILPVIDAKNEFVGVVTASKLRQQLANNLELEL